MDLTALSGVDLMTAFQTPQVASKLTDKSDSMLVESEQQETAFDSVFQSALNLIEETNAYSNAAEEEEIKYALGAVSYTHLIAYMICRSHNRKRMYHCNIRLQ